MPLLFRECLKGLILFAVYFLSARFGLKLFAVSGFATFIWLPTGLSFAALLLWGRKLWPAIFLAATLVNFTSGATFFIAPIMGLGNTLEALIGVTLFLKFTRKGSRLERVRDVTVFVFFAALLSTAVSATVGVTTLYLAKIVTPGVFRTAWLAWWIGDVLSNLAFAPFFIVWSKLPKEKADIGKGVEGLILGSLVILSCLISFCDWPSQDLGYYIKPYWIFILLTWATLRFGQHANVLLVVGLSAIAIYGTTNGMGPYQSSSIEVNLLLLQIFTAAVALCGLFFGALSREKNEAIRMRSDFISIASHELRTPVTGLSLSVTVMKEAFQTENAPMRVQVIEGIDRQTKKLVRLVDSLLNVAQIEAGGLILEKRETNLSALVIDLLKDLSDVVSRYKSELRTDIEPDIKIVCSPYGIEQVLSNLVINALKYGDRQPVIVSLTKEPGWACLSIKDHGNGIAPENQERVFGRYERVDSVPGSEGLGLGLYVSKLIVEDHNGSIKVESQLNGGSTFSVRLPL